MILIWYDIYIYVVVHFWWHQIHFSKHMVDKKCMHPLMHSWLICDSFVTHLWLIRDSFATDSWQIVSCDEYWASTSWGLSVITTHSWLIRDSFVTHSRLIRDRYYHVMSAERAQVGVCQWLSLIRNSILTQSWLYRDSLMTDTITWWVIWLVCHLFVTHLWLIRDSCVTHSWLIRDSFVTYSWLIRDLFVTHLWLIRDSFVTHLWLIRDSFVTHTITWLVQSEHKLVSVVEEEGATL